MKLDFREIDYELIDPPEVATRAEIDDQKLQELADSIRKSGLWFPIIVKPKAERFEVVDGHRRYLACGMVPLKKVPCRVKEGDSTPDEEVKLKANLLGERNNDAELAVYIGELSDKHGWSLERLVTELGKSESWINERYALLRGDLEVLNALGRGEINFSHAKALNACKDDKIRAQGLYFAVVEQIPATRLHEWLQRNVMLTQVLEEAKANPVEPVAAAVDISTGLVCVWCGGTHMPQMMLNFFIHKWEWDIIMQVREMYMAKTAGEIAGAEPAPAPAPGGVE